MGRRPGEGIEGLARVDRIAPIVPRAVLDEALEVAVVVDILALERVVVGCRSQALEGVAERVDDFQVRAFAAASERVLLARGAGLERACDALAVVGYEDPVADVAAVAIDRSGLPSSPLRIIKGISFSGN